MKLVRRYYAVIGRRNELSIGEQVKHVLCLLVGIKGTIFIQTSVHLKTDWGFVLKVTDASGKNTRMIPLALSLCDADENMQCFASSGTLKGLERKVKELGLVM